MVKYCQSCNVQKAFMVRPKTGNLICQNCFFQAFEEEIHHTIISTQILPLLHPEAKILQSQFMLSLC
ncbi:unnamed protein product (macronuclear) [Paramecium tetraurelia]|uniref:Uncharacterized protein n=1 Tax=Paramecium tetraurelia TaxID=5888 RepID=A0EE11_PARTE|nr:uncharacterized protein GSPATT00025872001 [Paramecium tetraurelia]CAK93528.1 unnamed protein product [Paramecium tetraurelia]|eukprot:XP_001460925.1 hypothetical protein (macronuclear) [Paramecium tetraurelia strain d4-2]